VVVLVLDEFEDGLVVVVLVFVVSLVSLVFSVVGFTTVVLFSTFFSGAGDAGATTSVFCSHAPRSAALAKMQINFFIIFGLVAHLGHC
jgi:phage-related protein